MSRRETWVIINILKTREGTLPGKSWLAAPHRSQNVTIDDEFIPSVHCCNFPMVRVKSLVNVDRSISIYHLNVHLA